MEVVREIELDAEAEDVWEALTNESQLEEWFANDVELDPSRRIGLDGGGLVPIRAP